MGRYLLRRLVISIPVLIGISMFTFAMVAIAPGNAVTAMINPEAAGWLEAGLTCGYSKFATDCEQLVGWYKYAGGRLVRRFQGCDGGDPRGRPAGPFPRHPAHARAFRVGVLHAELMDFNSFEQWNAEGAKDHDTRGREKARNMLQDYEEPKLDEGIAEVLQRLHRAARGEAAGHGQLTRSAPSRGNYRTHVHLLES